MAGFVAPFAFTVLVVVQGLLQRDYSHVALPISALAAWPLGAIQNVNFSLFAVLITAFAIGLHRDVRPRRGGVIALGLLTLSGIGLLMAGAFPWRGAGGQFIVPAGHIAGAALTFFGAGTGLIAISRQMSGDPRWRDLARYALASGIAIIVLFLLAGLSRAEDAALHPWLGLLQRLTLAVWFPCIVVLARRLWHVVHAVEQATDAGPADATARVVPPRSA